VRRSLLGALVVFAGLLAVTLLVLRREDPGEAPPFFQLARRVPDTLTVVSGRDTTVLVPDTGGSWTLVYPVVYPADGLVVDAMLKRQAPLEVLRTFPLPPEKMDTYGMRFPRGSIRAAYRDGRTPDTLVIGGFTPDAAFGYVRPGSRDEVGLLEDRILDPYLLKETIELRDTRLIPFPESRAVAVRLLGPAEEVRLDLRREENGEWVFVRPFPGPADGEKMREYLKSISHMHIREFVPNRGPDLARYGLDRPRAAIRVLVAPGETVGFDMGEDVPGTDQIYAKSLSRPEIVEVSDKYLPILLSDGVRLRAGNPIPFGLSVVDEVEIHGKAGWGSVPVSPPEGTVPGRTRTILGRWVTLEARTVEEATPASMRARGLRPPAGELLWTSGPDTLARLEVGKKKGDLRALHVGSGVWARPHEIFLVPEAVIDPLWSATLTLVEDRGEKGTSP
jgi:hypothetical protein